MVKIIIWLFYFDGFFLNCCKNNPLSLKFSINQNWIDSNNNYIDYYMNS